MNMQEIYAGTMRAQELIRSYLNALKNKQTYIRSVYKNPSSEKMRAWATCMFDYYYKLAGKDIAIVSANKYQFNVMFKFKKNGRDYYAYITKKKQYCIAA